jgi:myo-inositol-hexaphosphate 3-phosphohydrolase
MRYKTGIPAMVFIISLCWLMTSMHCSDKNTGKAIFVSEQEDRGNLADMGNQADTPADIVIRHTMPIRHVEIEGECLGGPISTVQDSGYMVLEVDGNDIHILHYDAYYNCGLEYVVHYTIHDFAITALEDNVGIPAFCNCYFDLESIVYDLIAGMYTVTLIGIHGDTVGVDSAWVGM